MQKATKICKLFIYNIKPSKKEKIKYIRKVGKLYLTLTFKYMPIKKIKKIKSLIILVILCL